VRLAHTVLPDSGERYLEFEGMFDRAIESKRQDATLQFFKEAQ